MKNLYLLTFLVMTTLSQAQIVNIPDPNFKDALVNHNVADFTGDGAATGDADTNNDGEIQESEAEALLGLYVTSFDISSLEGISSFVNIETLYCFSNQLTSLNLTQNINLVEVQCLLNQLTSLDVTQNPNLEVLLCDWNLQLASLDVSQNPNLEFLSCRNIQLTSLDVTQNPNLTFLNTRENQLTGLDITQNPNLEELRSQDNHLTSLDLTQNLSLRNLYCQNNQLTSLDLTQNPNLTYLYCLNNQLTTLDLKSGGNIFLNRMQAYDNPNLLCIQVDDETATYPVCDLNNGIGWCKDATAMYSENCVLGLEEYSNIAFTIYPNPAHNVLNIQVTEPIDVVQIYSTVGNLILETSNSNINVSDLQSGLYFVKVSINGKILSKKFVKS